MIYLSIIKQVSRLIRIISYRPSILYIVFVCCDVVSWFPQTTSVCSEHHLSNWLCYKVWPTSTKRWAFLFLLSALITNGGSRRGLSSHAPIRLGYRDWTPWVKKEIMCIIVNGRNGNENGNCEGSRLEKVFLVSRVPPYSCGRKRKMTTKAVNWMSKRRSSEISRIENLFFGWT